MVNKLLFSNKINPLNNQMIYKTAQKDHKTNCKYPDKVWIEETQLKYTFETKKERFVKVVVG